MKTRTRMKSIYKSCHYFKGDADAEQASVATKGTLVSPRSPRRGTWYGETERRGALITTLIVLFSTMLSSCVNDVPYNAEIGSPKLVLNALLLPDSILTATVSRTVHFLDTEAPQRLADATVTATVNGRQMGLTYDTGSQDYRNTYRLNAGDEVTLTATHTLGTATATQHVMPQTPISVINTTMQPFVNPGDPVSLATLNDVNSAMLVSLHINDPADETNYYRLTIDYKGSYEVQYPEGIYGDEANYLLYSEEGYFVSEETFYPHYLLTESSSRLVIDSESASQLLGDLLYMTSSNSFVFSDERLRKTHGQPVIDFLMLMELPRSSNDMYNPESGWTDDNDWDNDFIFPADTVRSATYHYHFTLETLSEDYYHYLTTVSSYDLTGGTMVSEPVRIHSNVSTGIGIVGSYNTVEIKDSVKISFEK